jgi:hypothetical protein
LLVTDHRRPLEAGQGELEEEVGGLGLETRFGVQVKLGALDPVQLSAVGALWHPT